MTAFITGHIGLNSELVWIKEKFKYIDKKFLEQKKKDLIKVDLVLIWSDLNLFIAEVFCIKRLSS